MYTFINWNDLEFKKTSGKEKLRCISCDKERSDKKDKALAIDHNNGFGKCQYCEALTFRDSNRPVNSKTYKLPAQNWKNHTKLSDDMIKWLEGRKIAQFAVKDLGWTEETHWQPKRKAEVNNLVFNTFEGETLVNKKYRDGDKNFTQSAGTKSMFYNINSIIGAKEAYIVEGELDVAAMVTYGIKNVVSPPNGANDNDDYWANSEPYLKGIEKFVIATDNDDKGIKLRDAIAQRLGRYRCVFVEFVNKDANGDLIEGVLKESLEGVKRFPISGTFSVSDLKPAIMDLYNNGQPSTIYPKHACFGKLKDIFTVMMGHLVVGTGIPSHGKSNWVEWYVLNLIYDYGFKSSFFSPEHMPMALHQTTLIEKAIGKNFWDVVDGIPRITPNDIDRYEKWANEKIYLTSPDNGTVATSEWLLGKFKEHIYAYGTKIFVIDAFNKVQLPRGDKLEETNLFLTQLTNFAQVYDVIIFLVAHPKKMQLTEEGIYAQPSLYDVSGSADFRNQTHDGFGIYRFFDKPEQKGYMEFTNLKTKMKFQGEIGAKESFDYIRANGRYCAQKATMPTFDMTKKEEDNEAINDMLTSVYDGDMGEFPEAATDDIPF